MCIHLIKKLLVFWGGGGCHLLLVVSLMMLLDLGGAYITSIPYRNFLFVHIILRGEGGRIYPLVELLPSIENTCFTHYITINGVYIHTPLGVLLPGVETTRFTHHITRREGGGGVYTYPPGCIVTW